MRTTRPANEHVRLSPDKPTVASRGGSAVMDANYFAGRRRICPIELEAVR